MISSNRVEDKLLRIITCRDDERPLSFTLRLIMNEDDDNKSNGAAEQRNDD